MAGLLALLWVPRVRCPERVAQAAGVLASTSLFVYVSHWQVYPHLEHRWPLGAVLASFAVGLAYARAYRGLAAGLSSWARTSMRVDASGTPAVCAPSARAPFTRRRMRASERRTNTTCM